MILFKKNLDCSICPVKDGKKSIATIISDDGDMETSKILSLFARKYDIRLSIASPVDNLIKNLRYWQLLEKNFPIEIINHSWNHLRIDDDSKIRIEDIRHQYLDSKAFFRTNFSSPSFSFVPPNNQLTPNGFSVLREGGFLAVRSWHRGFNSLNPCVGTEPGQWHNLKCRGIGDNDFNIQGELVKMSTESVWLIEMWHNVYTTTKANYQPIHIDEAERHILAIKENPNVWLAGFNEAVSYLYQRANVEIVSFLHDGIIHLKLNRKNKLLPWDQFISPLSVRIEKSVMSSSTGLPQAMEGIEGLNIVEDSGEMIVNIRPGIHGQIRMFS